MSSSKRHLRLGKLASIELSKQIFRSPGEGGERHMLRDEGPRKGGREREGKFCLPHPTPPLLLVRLTLYVLPNQDSANEFSIQNASIALVSYSGWLLNLSPLKHLPTEEEEIAPGHWSS